MGERGIVQPLTREDTITVLLYRAGIALSCLIISGLAYIVTASSGSDARLGRAIDILAYGLYTSVGMSVFFIHLYVGRFKTLLKNLYFISLACLVLLVVIGKGSLSGAFSQTSYSALLLLPLSGCLGFVTAKEAFCFRLLEGYLLAIIMPVYLLLASGSFLGFTGIASGLALIAVMLVIFTLRKIFMPLSYDIGDKSAYQR